jgi:glycosyltransferase involved in cell wall biosynthesis
MPITRVHLTAGDGCNWAIDEDLRLVRSSLAGVCEITSLARAQAVHAGWWVNLTGYAPADLRGKQVICTAENSPFYYVTEPEFLRARAQVTQWIARSREAMRQFATLGIESKYAAYTFDPAVFHPLPKDHHALTALMEKWKIPRDKYLIANFHRDTEGADQRQPKLQKGPDLFLEIVTRIHAEHPDVHVLLAGPRRFWLRRELTQRGVPFTFVGEDTGTRDDLSVNTLPRTTLNLLYNRSHLHVVSSRWEGGPQSILESAATRCKIISTRVGLAADVLEPECLFENAVEACELAAEDIRHGTLERSAGVQLDRALAAHTEPVLRENLAEIYRTLEPLEPASLAPVFAMSVAFRRVRRRLLALRKNAARPPSIALLHRTDVADAWFDGFLDRLTTELEARGCPVRRNVLEPAPEMILIGTLGPDDPLLGRLREPRTAPVIGLLDDSAGRANATTRLAVHRELDDCVIAPSIDALAALQELPRDRMLVFAPALETPLAGDAVSQNDSCTIAPGEAWAAGRVAQAQAAGRATLYPADSHYAYLVWFGGLSYAAAADLPAKLEILKANDAMFRRLVIPPRIGAYADRLLRLGAVCRELGTKQRS